MLAAMPATAVSAPAPGEPSPRDRGDACPGSLRLHRADDGRLARVRIPGGVLTATQAEALGEAATALGDRELHLTSRGNVQLRGLGEQCGDALADRLGAAELLPSATHERIRNVVASPFCGLDGRGHRDVRPWLTALDALLCASGEAAGLSGRFLFALDDGRGDVDALGADVTLRAAAGGDALLRIGAASSVARLAADDGPRAALLAALAFLDPARETGAWRVAELPFSSDELTTQVVAALGRAGVDVKAMDVREAPTRAAEPAYGVAGSAAHVGLPLGRATAAQWATLSRTARRGGGELRLTPWRGVVLPGLPDPGTALTELSGAGLITGPASVWAGVGACVGAPGCAKSRSDVRAEATAAAAPAPAGALPVYWSGCERRCGHPRGDRVDVLATGSGHTVTVVRDGVPGTPETVSGDPARLTAAVSAARRRNRA